MLHHDLHISILHHFFTSQASTFVLVWYAEAVYSPWLCAALCVKFFVYNATPSLVTDELPHWLFWLIVMVVTPVICGWKTIYQPPQSGIWGWMKVTKNTSECFRRFKGLDIRSALGLQMTVGGLMIETWSESNMNKPWDWYQISLQDMLRLVIWASWDTAAELQCCLGLFCNSLCVAPPSLIYLRARREERDLGLDILRWSHFRPFCLFPLRSL